jgi:hypothetical protein
VTQFTFREPSPAAPVVFNVILVPRLTCTAARRAAFCPARIIRFAPRLSPEPKLNARDYRTMARRLSRMRGRLEPAATCMGQVASFIVSFSFNLDHRRDGHGRHFR